MCKPQFGERVREWSDIRDDIYSRPSEDERGEPRGYDTSGMQRLRGLIVVQAAETEAVLGRILRKVDPQAKPGKKMAGGLLKEIYEKLPGPDKIAWLSHVRQIVRAQWWRNLAVHHTVETGYTWADHATGGGEWVPVVTAMDGELCTERELRGDLALQQTSTVLAIEMLHGLSCTNHSPYEDCPDWWE